MRSSTALVLVLLASFAVAQSGRRGNNPPNPYATLGAGTGMDTPVEGGFVPNIPRGGDSVNVADFGIPTRAKQEFNEANDLFRKQEFQKAREKFRKAISLYPDYAEAYANLGVVCERLNDREQAHDALEKSLAIDDHNPLAHLNMGRLEIKMGNFPAAETNLRDASKLNPSDASAMVLLAYTALLQGQTDEVIATAQKVHALAEQHALAHRIAARALAQVKRYDEAIGELQKFLQEEGSGPQAEQVRHELKSLQSSPK